MDTREECDHSLPSTDISLEEACHRMWLFHIFQYLEEYDFLLIRQGKWETCDELFHEIGIYRGRDRMSLTRRKGTIFFLETTSLECEEFSISELSFCSLECLYRSRKMYIANICTFHSESFFLAYLIRDIISYLIDVSLHETHLLSDPRPRDVVHVTIDWYDFSSRLAKVLDICTIP
jgi:hypothetical protein